MAKKSKKAGSGRFPFPGMPSVPKAFPWKWDEKASKKKCAKATKRLLADMAQLWGKSIAMQKAAKDGSKKQYEQFFAHMMDWENDLASSLSEDIPQVLGVPALPSSPKELLGALKELQELSNVHFTVAADSFGDFFIQLQQEVCDQMPEAPQDEDEAEESAEDEAADEAPEEPEEPAEEETVEEPEEVSADELAEDPAEEEVEEVIEELVEEEAEEPAEEEVEEVLGELVEEEPAEEPEAEPTEETPAEEPAEAEAAQAETGEGEAPVEAEKPKKRQSRSSNSRGKKNSRRGGRRNSKS